MQNKSPLLLRGLNQENQGRVFEIADRLLVGRSRKCDILLDDGLVSRQHARFECRSHSLYLCDLSSRNGTFVNQNPIEGETKLSYGDKVRIGRSEFLFLDPANFSGNQFELIDDIHFSFSEPVTRRDLTLNNARITNSFLIKGDRNPSVDRSDGSQSDEIESPRWFDVLFAINREIQTQPDPREMSLAVSNLLLEVLDGDRCIVALLNGKENLELHTVAEKNPTATSTSPVQLSRTIMQQVIEGRCAMHVNDIRQDKRFVESDSLLLSQIRSLLVAPLIIGNQVLGLIEVSRADSRNAFNDAALDLVSIAGSILGAALKHAEQLTIQENHIAELEEAHRQLELAQQDLVRSQQLAVLGRMASSINHEIGNLLMPLLEHHTAKVDGEEEEEFEIFTPEELAYSCTQIKSLIEDIKHFSRGTDRMPQMSRCDLSEQVQKATRFVQIDRELFPPSGSGQIRITLDCQDKPSVIIDPLQIGRVIINLLRNAAQAMRGQSEEKWINIRVFSELGNAILEVEDNGPGILEEVRNKLFEPFISTKGDQGLGLGLDISRKIVFNHGGQIEFKLGEHRGTTFTITLLLNPTLKTTKSTVLDEIESIPSLPTASDEF